MIGTNSTKSKVMKDISLNTGGQPIINFEYDVGLRYIQWSIYFKMKDPGTYLLT